MNTAVETVVFPEVQLHVRKSVREGLSSALQNWLNVLALRQEFSWPWHTSASLAGRAKSGKPGCSKSGQNGWA